VRIHFDRIDLEEDIICRYDYVKVIEDGTPIGRACGNRWSDIVSHGNVVTVQFVSDRSNTGAGFHADFSGYIYNVEQIARPACGAVTQRGHHGTGQSQVSFGPSVRIVGGTQAQEGDWPWQISLLIDGAHQCGGSIINDNWIITAAHCVDGSENRPELFSVVIGEHDRHEYEGAEVVYPVRTIISHPQYNNPRQMDNDIALIELDRSIFWQRDIRPICLPGDVGVPDGENCWTSGWGNTEGTADSFLLQEVDAPILNTDDCNQPESYDGAVTGTMICAGHPSGGKDSCQGDSGGPLVCRIGSNNGDPWVLQGVTSWGIGCADANKPGIYNRVTTAMQWIRDTVGTDYETAP